MGSGDFAQNYLTPHQVVGLTGVTALAAGSSHTCAVSGGGVFCWGLNDAGQLGTGDTTFSNIPHAVSGLSGVVALAAGYQHTCALLNTGGVSCWGDNSYGQLGSGNNTQYLTPHTMPSVSSATR